MNQKRYTEECQSKPSCDTTCLNPNNVRFNMIIETYNTAFQSLAQDLSNAINPASLTGLVVELQQIEKGTLMITN
jgi:hypothetical protein